MTGCQQTGPYPPADPGSAAARSLIRQADDLSAAITGALAAPEARRKEAQRAYGTGVRAECRPRRAAHMPLERIKDVTQGRSHAGRAG